MGIGREVTMTVSEARVFPDPLGRQEELISG